MKNSLEAGRRPGNGGDLVKENLGRSVEIRLADLEKDIEALAGILGHPEVIEHESGIAPADTERNIEAFKQNIKKYIDLPDDTPPEAIKRIAENTTMARPTDLKKYFSGLIRKYGAEVYVAEINEKIVGTATLTKPTEIGKLWATVSKVAVLPTEQRKGIAKNLINYIEDRAFNHLRFDGIDATVINNVEGERMPKLLFTRLGWEGGFPAQDFSTSWDNASRKFVKRSVSRYNKKNPRASVAA